MIFLHQKNAWDCLVYIKNFKKDGIDLGFMKDIVRKYVLKNAVDFNGKANSKVVLGLVLKEDPSLKSNVGALLAEIDLAAKDVGALPADKIKAELAKYGSFDVEQKQVVQGPLKPLPNAEMGNVVVRIAPSPSGPLHIGHAYATSLNYEYAKMYGGKLLLRIEDTNAENIYPQAYELIERDAQWLTDQNIAKVFVQSDRLEQYYTEVRTLIDRELVYICTCDADVWREMKNQGRPCPCRELEQREQQQRFQMMFKEYAEGEAVVRFKTDITHKNPAMRDFPIMRIVEHVHPKTGTQTRVWPLMIFSVAIDDHEMGVTHVLNGKDHADNAAKERIIMDGLGWKVPEYKHWGRINFDGFTLSTTQTKLAIEQGKYHSWDDIRIPFLPALRRRGYQPGAFRRFALEIGLSLNDKTVSVDEFWKNINAFNKEIVDPKANRCFFVQDPITVRIPGVKMKSVHLPRHPSFPERGVRELELGEDIYLSKKDIELLEEGKVHRLIEGYNFVVEKGLFKFHSHEYEHYKNAPNKGMIIQWLPTKANLVQIEVLLDDGSIVAGVGEPSMRNLPVGEIVQLERYYFARVDNNNQQQITLWYLHQ